MAQVIELGTVYCYGLLCLFVFDYVFDFIVGRLGHRIISVYFDIIDTISYRSCFFNPYFRFLKGAVDSEDLPLSLSREKAQNSNLVRRIKEVVTRKFLRFLSDEMKNNPASYREFYQEYHMFLKEGLLHALCYLCAFTCK